MVRIDPDRKLLEVNLINALEEVNNAEWNLKCYDNRIAISAAGLQSGKDYSFGTGENILAGKKSLEKCVFDGKILKICSPIIGGTAQVDHALYKCSKCNLLYDLPLNKQDRKRHDKGMRKQVY
jgi:hypothetical protein